MPSIEEGLLGLPPAYRDRALVNKSKYGILRDSDKATDAAVALFRSFTWRHSEEGYDFWSKVHCHLCDPENYDLPPLPE